MSRYSAFDGYWLFGFLVPALTMEEFDLLTTQVRVATPLETAAHLAQVKFADQLKKAGIDKECLRSVRLRITRAPEVIRDHVQIIMPIWRELEREGYKVSFLVEAELREGRCFAVERTAFVAPHDPAVERRYPSLTKGHS